jgi:metallo-beta-lactamase class B
MRSTAPGVFRAMGFAAALGSVSVIGQSAVPDTVAGHVAAAKTAGGDLWPSIVSQLCGTAEQAPPARGATAPQRGQQPPGPPPRSEWYHAPEKVFDNMYVLSTTGGGYGGVAAWAVNTSNGIILIDATYDYSVKDLLDSGLRQLGLNPAQIKDIVVTHGHGDHFGGVKYLQELYNPHVYLSAADWDLMASTPQGGNQGQPVPKKDQVAVDGQKLTVGDETITMYLTPGHTLGTISFLIPVKINGTPHLAAFWGGTAINRNTPADRLKMYSESARRFEQIAIQAKPDIMLSNHDGFGEYFKRVAAMKANPGGPNPFVVGVDGVRRYLQVLDQCSQALVLAQK